MADRKKMSVEEILAACRAADGGGSGQGAAHKPAAESSTTESSAPAKSAPKKKPREMSVEEILAAARAEKQGGGKAAGARGGSPKPAAPKVAAKVKLEGAGKPAAKKEPAGKPAAPMDTASILAAARAGAKRGPVSKTEAAAAGRSAEAKPRRPVMPARPAALTRRTSSKPAEPATRRGFFHAVAGMAFGSAMAVGFVSLAVTSLLGVLGFARFMFPNILIEPPTRFRVGFKDEFGPGQVQTKFKAQFGVWIVRNEIDGQDIIYALRSVCTHLGCTPNWLEAEQKFKCPCHGSGFYKSGVNFEGPAPRPLERYAIHVADDGQLEVDKSRVFRQEFGQWANPESYVVV